MLTAALPLNARCTRKSTRSCFRCVHGLKRRVAAHRRPERDDPTLVLVGPYDALKRARDFGHVLFAPRGIGLLFRVAKPPQPGARGLRAPAAAVDLAHPFSKTGNFGIKF